MTEIKSTIENKSMSAKEASVKLANISTNIKNDALLKMADELIKRKEEIFKANEIDVESAKIKGVKING